MKISTLIIHKVQYTCRIHTILFYTCHSAVVTVDSKVGSYTILFALGYNVHIMMKTKWLSRIEIWNVYYIQDVCNNILFEHSTTIESYICTLELITIKKINGT